MPALTGQTIAATYQQLLNTVANSGFTSTLTVIEDGYGVASSLSLATLSAAFSGTLNVAGNFSVNTSQFTVAASSGNTAIAGTLGVAGNVSVNSTKFTVDSATGNTVVDGTLTVASDTFLNGNATVLGSLNVGSLSLVSLTLGTLDVSTSLNVGAGNVLIDGATGNITSLGVLDVDDNSTFQNDLNVVGTLTAGVFSPTNLTVTNDLTVNNDVNVNNNFTVQGSTGNTQIDGTLGVTGTITGSLNGNASTATSAATLTTARTIGISGDITGTATSFDGSSNITISSNITAGSIVDADINASAAIADTKLAAISTAGKVSNSATTATTLNTANTIVLRGATGGFSAGAVTATSFSGPLTGTVGASGANTGDFTTLTSSSTATLGPTSLIGLGLDVRGFMNVENNVGIGTIRARDDNHLISLRGLYGAVAYSDVTAFYEYGDFVFFNDGLIAVQTEKFRIASNGFVQINGSLGRKAPITKTADFTVAFDENWIICNKTSSMLVTLPAAATFSGREIHFKNITANAVNSATTNVIPITGGAATSSILPAGAGNWCTIVSNGTNWEIMQSS